MWGGSQIIKEIGSVLHDLNPQPSVPEAAILKYVIYCFFRLCEVISSDKAVAVHYDLLQIASCLLNWIVQALNNKDI